MILKLLPRILFVCMALFALNVHAAIVTQNLTGTVDTGPFTGQTGTGSFSYDDSFLSGVGTEWLDIGSGLTIEFTIFGQTFTEDDAQVFGQPNIMVVDGVETYLDYSVYEPVTNINLAGVNGFNFYNGTGNNLTQVNGGFETVVSVEAVPVPAAVWLFGSGLIGLVGIARRKKA